MFVNVVVNIVKTVYTPPPRPGSKVITPSPWTTPPPLARVKGHNTSPWTTPPPWPGSKVITPPLRQHLPPPWPGSKVITPLPPSPLTTPHLDNTSLSPWTTPSSLPPPSPPPPGLCAGGRYASYWNAFLLIKNSHLICFVSTLSNHCHECGTTISISSASLIQSILLILKWC